MANLFDLIKDRITDKRLQEYAANMQPLQPADNTTGGAAPLVTGLQIGDNGELIERNMPPEQFGMGSNLGSRIKNGIKNFNLGDAILGKQAAPTDNIGDLQSGEVTIKDDLNPDGELATYNAGIGSTISQNPRRGGLINDITAGARENFNNSFRGENWANNIGTDGRQKGFAYRLGEGIGTLGRFANSPIGRGLLMTAFASGVNGSDMAESLAYGVSTAAKNQQNRTADKLYRGQLKNYGMTDEDLNNIRGYVGKDDFNTLASNLYKNENLELRKQSTASMNRLRELQSKRLEIINSTLPEMEKAKLEKALAEAAHAEEMQLARIYNLYTMPQVALGQLGVAQGRLGLAQDQFGYQMAKDEYDRTHPKGANDMVNNLGAIKEQLDRFSASFDKVDNPYRYRVAGGASNFLNTLTEDEANFNSQASLLLNKIARDLGGEKGVLSDQDIQRIKESMPTLKDTKNQKVAKMKAIYALLDDRMKFVTGGIMPRHYRPQSSGNRQQSQGMVRIKAPNGQIKLIPASQKDAAIKAGGKLL